jgi:hypothetical protein
MIGQTINMTLRLGTDNVPGRVAARRGIVGRGVRIVAAKLRDRQEPLL